MRVLLMGERKTGGYLWSVLKHSGIEFDQSPLGTDTTYEANVADGVYDVIILRKGYSAIGDALGAQMRDSVKQGTGLIMVGGWATYTGRRIEVKTGDAFTGGYKGTPIEEVLPVNLLDRDDRVNETLFLVVTNKTLYHKIFGEDMPLYTKAVCGCNAVITKKESTTILEGVKANYQDGEVNLSASYPVLITGTYGKGKTAAYTSDLGPHWAGNIVDWQRDKQHRTWIPPTYELGNYYIRFCTRLIQSLSQREA